MPKLLTNHALVLGYIWTHPEATMGKTAQATGLRERTIFDILKKLREAGLVSATRTGRQNHYVVDAQAVMECPVGSITIRTLIIDLYPVAKQDPNQGAS